MVFLLSFPTTTIGIGTIFVVVLILYSCAFKTTTKRRAPPKAGGAWPIIGHLHLLRRPQPPHIALALLADKYGPIFTINLGLRRVLVVSNSDTAKDCLAVHDKVFANRPKTPAMQHLGYNQAMFGFGPYGPFWRQMRKIVTLELLSCHRLEKMKHVRELEVKTSFKELHQLWVSNKSSSDEVLVDMSRWFEDMSSNVMFRVIMGKRYGNEGRGAEWKKSKRDFTEFLGRFVVGDALPFLRWLDLGGDEKAMKKTAQELDLYVEDVLKEHMKNKRKNLTVQEDFMSKLLSILDNENEIYGHSTADAINKATCVGLILAGSHTTTVTLTWALSLLLNNRDVLLKAQQELDAHVGKERLVEERDMKSLVYLDAIIKETLRLYPAAPLAIPHESTEDCTVAGYHIPAGTRLLVNLWKIHCDPTIWEEPYEFRPERFLTTHKDFDVKGNNLELMPFGSGRRICPGVLFALQVLQLTLANLLHGFDFATTNHEPVDMTASPGLNNLKATPLETLISPRLPNYLYDNI